ncbi:MAG: PilZ domain-containing protein [Nitrospirota bacterium]
MQRELYRVRISRTGQLCHGDRRATCEVVEVTQKGIGLKTEMTLAQGDSIELECALSARHPLRCTLQVIHAAYPHVGGRITVISPDHERQLFRFIEDHAAACLGTC